MPYVYTGESITKKVARKNVEGKKTVQGKQYKHDRDYERKVHWTFLLHYLTLPLKVEHIGHMHQPCYKDVLLIWLPE